MTQESQQPNPPTDPATDESAAEPFVIALPDESNSGRDWYLWAIALALLILVTFGPAVSGGFLWLDDQNVTQNLAVRNGQTGLQQIWSVDSLQSQYSPLTQTTYWIEFQLWKNWALGYRIVSLVFHAGAAILLWRVLRRLKMPGAWVIAALWAVHPLQAESVSWISQRGNVLSALLGLASVLFYLEFAGMRDPGTDSMVWKLNNKWQAYGFALGFFVAAILSKTLVVTLPVVILLVLWWKRRLTMETLGGLVPMLIISLGMAFLTIHIETSPIGAIAAVGKPWDQPLAVRLLVAGQALWFYVLKIVLPLHQSFSYDKVIPDAADSAQWMVLGAAVVALVASLLVMKKAGRGPLVALLCYFVLLFPLLGFFNVYGMLYSLVWDHYQYLASIPLIALAVGIIAKLFPAPPSTLAPNPAPVAPDGVAASAGTPANEVSMAVVVPAAVSFIIIGALAVAAWMRAEVFVSNASLWADTIDKNPQSWIASYMLAREEMRVAGEYLDQGAKFLAGGDSDSAKVAQDDASDQLTSAEALLQKTVDSPSANDFTRMQAYTQLGACQNLRAQAPGVKVEPLMVVARRYLKQAMMLENDGNDRNPDPAPAFSMGIATLTLAEAELQAQTPSDASAATRPTEKIPTTTRPASPDQKAVLDRFEEARSYFATAIEIASAGLKKPALVGEALRVMELAAYNRGNVDFIMAGLVLQRGDNATADRLNQDAISDYNLTIKLNPNKIDAHYKIALCYERFHQWDEAMAHLKAIIYGPDHHYYRAYNEIGNVLLSRPQATVADLDLAIQCFKDVLEMKPGFKDAQDNLAKAMLVLKQFRASSRPATTESTTPTVPAS